MKKFMTDKKMFTPCAPVLLIGFNRPDFMAEQISALRSGRPENIYIAVDGPRHGNQNDIDQCKKVKQCIELIDWPCKINTLFHDTNLGCKNAPISAINWLFANEEFGIILEDDCRPRAEFFRFATDMLRKYKDDNRIGNICGMNYFNLQTNQCDSYHFSAHMDTWGWASWRRVWQRADLSLRKFNHEDVDKIIYQSGLHRYTKKILANVIHKTIDCNGMCSWWDYQLFFNFIANNWLCIVPRNSIVANVGFSDTQATHTGYACYQDLWSRTTPLEFPLKHPELVTIDTQADQTRERMEAGLYPRTLTWVGSKARALRKYTTLMCNLTMSTCPSLLKY